MKIRTRFRFYRYKLHLLQKYGQAVKPNSDEEMTCKHCGTTFRGNFCPRCGQSRMVSEMLHRSFLNVFMEAYPQLAKTFFRTMKELIYRPGQMIRDYYRGHHIIYSGPFKTFIVAASVYLLLTQIMGINPVEEKNEHIDITQTEQKQTDDKNQKVTAKVGSANMDISFSDADADSKTGSIIKVDTINKADSKRPQSLITTGGSTVINTNANPGDVQERINRLVDKEKYIKDIPIIGPIWQIIKKKVSNGDNIYLFFFVPLLALVSKMTFRKTLFDGRKLIYAEHFMIYLYLYAIYVLFAIIEASGLNILFDASDITLFYFVWIYKGLYGLRWKKALALSGIFLFYLFMSLIIVICAMIVLGAAFVVFALK